jgi:hypothetical protein
VIRIHFDDATTSAGELLTGRVHWTADDDRGARAIVVAAQWQTSGAGNVAYGVGRGTRVALRDDQRSAEVPLRMLIPYEGPITFSGELIAVTWKLCVRVDRFGSDEAAEKEFVVAPRMTRLPSGVR